MCVTLRIPKAIVYRSTDSDSTGRHSALPCRKERTGASGFDALAVAAVGGRGGGLLLLHQFRSDVSGQTLGAQTKHNKTPQN